MPIITLQSLVSGGPSAIRGAFSIDCDEILYIEKVIPADSIDLELLFGVDLSTMEFAFMLCDGTVTVRTNDSGTPQETFNLFANVPYQWMTGNPTAHKPFSNDITGFYITEGSGTDRNLALLFGSNP